MLLPFCAITNHSVYFVYTPLCNHINSLLSQHFSTCKQLTKTLGSRRPAVDWILVVYLSSVNFAIINATMSLYSISQIRLFVKQEVMSNTASFWKGVELKYFYIFWAFWNAYIQGDRMEVHSDIDMVRGKFLGVLKHNTCGTLFQLSWHMTFQPQ